MKIKNLQILVIGAGGIDGITAAHMKKAGYNVEVEWTIFLDCLPGYRIRAALLEAYNKDLALRYYNESEASSGSDTFVQLVQKDFD